LLKIECDCGQRGYLDYMFEDENKIILSLDIDTMGLEYNDENGIEFKCPHCKKIYNIIRVQ